MAARQGGETARGGLESADGTRTRAGAVAHGVVFERGNRDGRAIPRAHQARELDGVPPVSVHPIARLLGTAGGRDAVADKAFVRQIAREPRPAWSRFIAKGQLFGLRLDRAGEVVNVTLAGAHGTAGGDLSVVSWRAVGDGHRGCGDVHADVKRARLAHG